MSETEQMLLQTLKRMEENYETRLKECGTRLEELEERQMLLVAEVRSLKKLFSDVEAVYSNLQTLLLRLKNAGAGAQQPAHTDAMRRTHGKVQAHCNERHQGHAENAG
mgnify:CR=1 FL=1